ncbi:MAG: hypothetical protein WCT00_03905, partial [Bacilli bacterium]
LKKLSQIEYIKGIKVESEKANGLTAISYECTEKGITELKNIVIHSLTNAREHDRKFDLALSVSQILDKEEVIQCLTSRISRLESEKQE